MTSCKLQSNEVKSNKAKEGTQDRSLKLRPWSNVMV